MWQDLGQGPELDYDGGKASVLVVHSFLERNREGTVSSPFSRLQERAIIKHGWITIFLSLL